MAELLSPSQLCLKQEVFKAPDFVVARKHKRFWNVKQRVFDYEGRYRKANALA